MVTFIKSKKFLLILFLLLFVSSSTAFALEIDWPLSPGGTVLNDDSDVGDMIQYFYEWAIALGGLATFVSLVLGGFQYLSSMGRPEAMKEAKDRITSAFAGLVLLLSAWLILNVINPDLTTFRKTSYNLSYLMEHPGGINLNELPGCDYVILYPRENFGENNPPDNIRLTGLDGYFITGVGNVGSVKSFSKSALEEFGCTTPDCPCEGHACGCTLELYAEGYDKETNTVLPCGDKLGNVPAWDLDLLSHEGEGQEINCVRLSGIACKCRLTDANTGECTTNVSPDTGWGDNDYNCIGTNEEVNNTRCFDGKCITCGGTALPDGCGGCANQNLIPGYTGSSDTACWYVGRANDWDAGDSCTATCNNHGGCIPANWDDDSSCTTGKALWGCEYCKVQSLWAEPGYWGGLGADSCTYRADDFGQRCGDVYWAFARRFCVCRE